MAYSDDELERNVHHTAARCHICGLKLARADYGLHAAQITCHRCKKASSIYAVQRRHGFTRPAKSTQKRREEQHSGGVVASALGLLAGLFHR
jgi:phage FluMu protein Com